MRVRCYGLRMPPRTFTLALKKTLDRKQRRQQSLWRDLCVRRIRDIEVRNAKAEKIARSVMERFTALPMRSREHLTRVLAQAMSPMIDERRIFGPLSSPKSARR